MYSFKSLFALLGQAESEEEEDKKGELVDVHTFVALIDIIFTDYSKRTCTGTIIHDNVVITAAHCFFVEKKPNIKPELTASFVVIGTKKMFETKYEQYLPIERVITHPDYKGWKSDIALVYTFSGMTSDKPGTTIPLDGEKTSTPVDSNVTVLSWGVCLDDDRNDNKVTEMDKSNFEGEKDEDFESDRMGHALRTAVKAREDSAEMESDTTSHRYKRPLYRYPEVRGPRYNLAKITKPPRTTTPFTTRYQSRYLSSGEMEAENKSFKHRSSSVEINSSSESDAVNSTQRINFRANEDYYTRNREFNPPTQKKYGFKSLYHNWRRSMGSQQNKLTVDIFGFVNMQACKKMVERATPAGYEIRDSNDIVCYASEEHYITTEDSGAPAIRLGHLVAVTVGGVECDGDHVAIGMKMSCYCSWVVANLPSDAPKIKCCKNCCEQKPSGEYGPGRNQYHKMRLN